jgi:hypothetical protein
VLWCWLPAAVRNGHKRHHRRCRRRRHCSCCTALEGTAPACVLRVRGKGQTTPAQSHLLRFHLALGLLVACHRPCCTQMQRSTVASRRRSHSCMHTASTQVAAVDVSSRQPEHSGQTRPPLKLSAAQPGPRCMPPSPPVTGCAVCCLGVSRASSTVTSALLCHITTVACKPAAAVAAVLLMQSVSLQHVVPPKSVHLPVTVVLLGWAEPWCRTLGAKLASVHGGGGYLSNTQKLYSNQASFCPLPVPLPEVLDPKS